MKIISLCTAIMACLLSTSSCTNKAGTKIPIYGWAWENEGQAVSDDSIAANFKKWKAHGLDGICYNVGFNAERHARIARIAHENGLEYQAWIPAMLQNDVDSTWYAINRNGDSAYDVQAYVPHYKCMCPNNLDVVDYLVSGYSKIAEIADVDYVQLDYIRYVDVILPRGLWERYGLVMNEEYPMADYCYCPKCVADFKEVTGIDIKAVEDPSTCEEWKQFRYDVITKLVGRIAEAVHAQGKKISADVFPGPDSYAKKMVRQEWNKWDVDAIFPMNYNGFYMEPASWIGEVVKEEVSSVNGEIPIYSGLFVCKDWEKQLQIQGQRICGLTPSEFAEAVRSSLEAGATGISLFAPTLMTDAHWAELNNVIGMKP